MQDILLLKNDFFCKMSARLLRILLLLGVLMITVPTALAAETPLITSVDELAGALINANDGDTILVGDIVFRPMPMGMIVVPENVTIKSGKDTNAVFTNATFVLNGTTADSSPLTVRFENIDFRGDQAGVPLDPAAPPSVSTELPDIMNTMCAAIFSMNVDAAYIGCTFEGYHYGYGGVLNAIYSSEDNKNTLKLSLIDCSFRNNASKYGGSIYVSGYGHNINLDARRCAFENNAAATGGAIWAQDAKVHLLDCTFAGNQYLAENVSTPDGGALAIYGCNTELDGCLITGNTSGGRGGGVFCEILPFKTLVMENCTVADNAAAEDESIAVIPAETKYDTAAAAHLYFSTLSGTQILTGHDELFGCLLVEPNADEQEPDGENGYCLTLTPEHAQERGLLPAAKHISLPNGEYPIPREETAGIAGGKFADSLGTLQVGDNYREEAALEIETVPGHAETVSLRYGDRLTLTPPERDGFAFAGWEYPKGTGLERETVFMGGELHDAPITACWRFLLSENLYVIWAPLLVLAACCTAVLILRKRKVPAAAAPAAEIPPEEAPTLPEDWVDRVCERPEITELISKREMEVLHKLLEGKSRKQIAEELFVTESTVKKHATSIYTKFEVSGRVELISKMAQM